MAASPGSITNKINQVQPGNALGPMRKATVKKKSIYRLLDEFCDFISIESARTFVFGVLFNEVHIAKEKVVTRPADPAYAGTYHIAFRKGEFHAQKDKAMSVLHQFLLGYGPDIDIIQNGDDFYVASRTIHNLVHGFKGYTISEEGRISKQIQTVDGTKTVIFKLKHLASFVAIGYFFGHSDIHSENWGTQENGEELLTYKIDDPDALDVTALSIPITKKTLASLGFPFEDVKEHAEATQTAKTAEQYNFSYLAHFINTKEFKDELKAMFVKIAHIKFQWIQRILQAHITDNSADLILWTAKKFMSLLSKSPEQLSQESGKPVHECSEFLKGFKESADMMDGPEAKEHIEKNSLKNILKLLEERHKQLRATLGIQPDLAPIVGNAANPAPPLASANPAGNSGAPLTPLFLAAATVGGTAVVAAKLPNAPTAMPRVP